MATVHGLAGPRAGGRADPGRRHRHGGRAVALAARTGSSLVGLDQGEPMLRTGVPRVTAAGLASRIASLLPWHGHFPERAPQATGIETECVTEVSRSSTATGDPVGHVGGGCAEPAAIRRGPVARRAPVDRAPMVVHQPLHCLVDLAGRARPERAAAPRPSAAKLLPAPAPDPYGLLLATPAPIGAPPARNRGISTSDVTPAVATQDRLDENGSATKQP